jgi:hypothetical protein
MEFFVDVSKNYLNIHVPQVVMTEASLLTYSTEKQSFDSVYERNKFYRGLFGYKQTVKKNGKEYEYDKDGLMDEVPNIRIDDSVFIVSKNRTPKVEEYFIEWRPKVSYHIFKVILEQKDLVKRIRGNKEQLGDNTKGETEK